LGHGALAINRLAKRIHNPARPGQAWSHDGTITEDMKLCARGYTLDRPKRHEQGTVFAKADNLGNQRLGLAARNLNPPTNR
jgi:hypothetical protein